MLKNNSLHYNAVCAKFREIPREFEVTAGQSHPRSSILVSIESAYATSYQSFVVTLDVSPTIFEILPFKVREWLVFPTRLLFDAFRSGGTRQNILDETYPAKTRGMGLPYAENFNRFCMIHPRDGLTDGRADGRTIAYSVLKIKAK